MKYNGLTRPNSPHMVVCVGNSYQKPPYFRFVKYHNSARHFYAFWGRSVEWQNRSLVFLASSLEWRSTLPNILCGSGRMVRGLWLQLRSQGLGLVSHPLASRWAGNPGIGIRESGERSFCFGCWVLRNTAVFVMSQKARVFSSCFLSYIYIYIHISEQFSFRHCMDREGFSGSNDLLLVLAVTWSIVGQP